MTFKSIPMNWKNRSIPQRFVIQSYKMVTDRIPEHIPALVAFLLANVFFRTFLDIYPENILRDGLLATAAFLISHIILTAWLSVEEHQRANVRLF